MKQKTFWEIVEEFREHNRKNGYSYGYSDGEEKTAVVVYSQSNFDKEYSELSRSYRISNFGGKAFFDGMCGNSIYGDCLDGSEYGVRLDAYRWKVEKCYIE
jgi:hypothetical protein